MQTFIVTQPGAFAYGEKSIPTPAAGEVRLAVKRLGFCGSDLSTFRGGNPLVTYPRVPGHEIAAVIDAVAADVPGQFKTGLFCTVMPYSQCGKCPSCRSGRLNACQHNQTLGVQQDGAFTDYIVVPWQKIVPAPGLTLAELALVEPLAVGFHAVSRGRITKNDTVMILGCGMIGLGAIAAAGIYREANVIAVDIDDAKLAIARSAGAKYTINSQTENLHEKLHGFTKGDGPNVVIEAVGTPDTFRAAVEEVAFAGRVVYIGYAKTPVSYETKFFVMKELDILGSRNSTSGDFQGVIEMLQTKRYPVEKTITRTVPFAQAGEALKAWSENPSLVTKIHVEV